MKQFEVEKMFYGLDKVPISNKNKIDKDRTYIMSKEEAELFRQKYHDIKIQPGNCYPIKNIESFDQKFSTTGQYLFTLGEMKK